MSEFVEFLHEVFESFGPIRSRRMFGGYGIYHEDLMFGLVADEQLYLKTDAVNLPEFIAAGCVPFEYAKEGKVMKMSYYLVPEVVYDEPDQAAYWANLAYAAAQRAHKSKPPNKR